MQRAIDQVSQSCDIYDLTIRTKRWVVHQQTKENPGQPGSDIGGCSLSEVNKRLMQYYMLSI